MCHNAICINTNQIMAMNGKFAVILYAVVSSRTYLQFEHFLISHLYEVLA
jgi:hypothetical protein